MSNSIRPSTFLKVERLTEIRLGKTDTYSTLYSYEELKNQESVWWYNFNAAKTLSKSYISAAVKPWSLKLITH